MSGLFLLSGTFFPRTIHKVSPVCSPPSRPYSNITSSKRSTLTTPPKLTTFTPALLYFSPLHRSLFLTQKPGRNLEVRRCLTPAHNPPGSFHLKRRKFQTLHSLGTMNSGPFLAALAAGWDGSRLRAFVLTALPANSSPGSFPHFRLW